MSQIRELGPEMPWKGTLFDIQLRRLVANLGFPSLLLCRSSHVSSSGSMTMLTRGGQRNYVEQYASVVYRQSSCIERSFDAHFLEFVAFSFVWAESFER